MSDQFVLEINGLEYTDFLDLTYTRDIEKVVNELRFNFTASASKTIPIRAGQACVLSVNGQPLLDGYLESLDVDLGVETHVITGFAVDKTIDMVDSTVGNNAEFEAPINLITIARVLLDSINLQEVQVINEAGSIANFSIGELVSSEITATVYETLNTYAKKRQVLLTTDGQGNLVITRAGVRNSGARLFQLRDNFKNNILKSAVRYDHRSRFNTYRMYSQENNSALGAIKLDIESSVNHQQETLDADIRDSRILDLLVESPIKGLTLKDRAIWQANMNKTESFDYTCRVQGATPEDRTNPWEPNTLVFIEDEFAGINGSFLIKEVGINYSSGEGTITTLRCGYRDSYALDLQGDLFDLEDRANKRSKKDSLRKRLQRGYRVTRPIPTTESLFQDVYGPDNPILPQSEDE